MFNKSIYPQLRPLMSVICEKITLGQGVQCTSMWSGGWDVGFTTIPVITA